MGRYAAIIIALVLAIAIASMYLPKAPPVPLEVEGITDARVESRKGRLYLIGMDLPYSRHTHRTARPWSRIPYKNGLPDGMEKGYYETGEILYTSLHKSGMLDGDTIFYRKNGVIAHIKTYHEGKLLRKIGYFFYESGHPPEFIEYFHEGKRHDCPSPAALKEELHRERVFAQSRTRQNTLVGELVAPIQKDDPSGLRCEYFRTGRLKAEIRRDPSNGHLRKRTYTSNGHPKGIFEARAPECRWQELEYTPEGTLKTYQFAKARPQDEACRWRLDEDFSYGPTAPSRFFDEPWGRREHIRCSYDGKGNFLQQYLNTPHGGGRITWKEDGAFDSCVIFDHGWAGEITKCTPKTYPYPILCPHHVDIPLL